MNLEQTLLYCELLWGKDALRHALQCGQTATMRPHISMITLGVADLERATIIKPAQDAFWGGTHGFFVGPDGFVWEVAWNPHLDLT